MTAPTPTTSIAALKNLSHNRRNFMSVGLASSVSLMFSVIAVGLPIVATTTTTKEATVGERDYTFVRHIPDSCVVLPIERHRADEPHARRQRNVGSVLTRVVGLHG